jgi:predicted N-acyltransferase
MLRRSRERIDVDVEAIQHPDPRTIAEIFNLFWQTYERAATKFERLNRRFFEVVAEKPVSHFIILREKHSREMVAFMLCFALGGRIINKFGGLDYRRPRNLFLNYRLWDAALDWALNRGAASIQSGQTGYAAKIEIGHRLVPLNNFCWHKNKALHTILQMIGQRVSWATLDHDLASRTDEGASLISAPEPAPSGKMIAPPQAGPARDRAQARSTAELS